MAIRGARDELRRKLGGRRARVAASIVIGVLTHLPAGLCFAHPDVETGRRLYEEGELLGALDAFERAESRSDLSRDDLVALFETRALVYLILGDEDALETELVRLATVSPRHRLSAEVPPEVQERFAAVRARMRGQLRLVVSVAPSALGVTLRARAEGDPAAVVRELRIAARPVGASAFRRGRGADLELGVEAGQDVEYFARAIGPGGVVVAARGTEDTPELHERAETDDGGAVSPWLWVGLGAGVVAAAVVTVTLAIVLSASGDQPTDVIGPMEDL